MRVLEQFSVCPPTALAAVYPPALAIAAAAAALAGAMSAPPCDSPAATSAWLLRLCPAVEAITESQTAGRVALRAVAPAALMVRALTAYVMSARAGPQAAALDGATLGMALVVLASAGVLSGVPGLLSDAMALQACTLS